MTQQEILSKFLFCFCRYSADISLKHTGLNLKIKYPKKLKCAIKGLEELMDDYYIEYDISIMPKSDGKEALIKELEDRIRVTQERIEELKGEE